MATASSPRRSRARSLCFPHHFGQLPSSFKSSRSLEHLHTDGHWNCFKIKKCCLYLSGLATYSVGTAFHLSWLLRKLVDLLTRSSMRCSGVLVALQSLVYLWVCFAFSHAQAICGDSVASMELVKLLIHTRTWPILTKLSY
jgi:hypothetical protein